MNALADSNDTGTIVPFLPFGDWVNSFVNWVTTTFSGLFDLVKTVLLQVYADVHWVFATPPFLAVAIVLSLVGWYAKTWRFGALMFVGFVVIAGVNEWDNAMATLSLTVIAAAIALIIAVPTGIWAARNDHVSRIVRPVLDFMQTMPAFVYLIPVIVIFLTGPVPGIVATVVFALAPGVRFTELGIRQVDTEVVEAGRAFGASNARILRQIQLPLALPTIMAGINQVIMLSLSMVVIAGLVGAGGLGQDVVTGLQTIQIPIGFDAGLSVVILAIFLDRITSGFADRTPVSKALALTRA
jgi:glycine betaine/proline transport system permease protein